MRASENEFSNELYLLPDIFRGNHFEIPDYQRGYAWGNEQVQELLDDIEHQVFDGVNHKHYTGTLVLLKKGDKKYEVVDGQQRLTTLSILLTCIGQKYLQENDQKEEFERFKFLYLVRGNFGNEKIVLRLNSDIQKSYEAVVLRGEGLPSEGLLASQERIFSAYALINNWIDQRKDIMSYVQIMHTIEKELGFLIYCPADDVETGVMFEVINNRGKKLSELEKVKNYLIYCSVKLQAPTIRDEINNAWTSIIKRLNFSGKTSIQDETSFLRYCLVIFFESGFGESKSGYDELKSKIDINVKSDIIKASAILKQIREFVEFISDASHWYARLFGFDRNGLSTEILHVFDRIAWQPTHAPIMPLFLSVMLKKGISENEKICILKLIEILNFRVYIAPGVTTRSDAGQTHLYRSAHTFFKNISVDNLNSDKIWLLKYSLVKFILEYSPDERFEKAFDLSHGKRIGYDYHRWEGLKYFLLNYEQFINKHATVDFRRLEVKSVKGKANDALSVEHIWAKKHFIRNLNSGPDSKIDDLQKRRLGNFVLLEQRINTQGSNNPADKKFDFYLNGQIEDNKIIHVPTALNHARQIGETIKNIFNSDFSGSRKRSNNFWLANYENVININEKNLIEFSKIRWSLNDFQEIVKIIIEKDKSEEIHQDD